MRPGSSVLHGGRMRQQVYVGTREVLSGYTGKTASPHGQSLPGETVWSPDFLRYEWIKP